MAKITDLTRRDILDMIVLEKINWAGRLEEPDFLARIFDLKAMPSTDGRFRDAYGDIWQHRVNNFDWEDDWVFHDDRFQLKNGDDEIFLRFLCETIHPVVRSDLEEVERLKQAFNMCLQHDGFELIEKTRISGKPVFAARQIEARADLALKSIRNAIPDVIDDSYLVQQITRMETAVNEDPGLAIGTSKELVEPAVMSSVTLFHGIPSTLFDGPSTYRAHEAPETTGVRGRLVAPCAQRAFG